MSRNLKTIAILAGSWLIGTPVLTIVLGLGLGFPSGPGGAGDTATVLSLLVGALIAWWDRGTSDTPRHPTDVVRTTKQCPDCSEMVLATARICRFCRYQFVGLEQLALAAPSQSSEETAIPAGASEAGVSEEPSFRSDNSKDLATISGRKWTLTQGQLAGVPAGSAIQVVPDEGVFRIMKAGVGQIAMSASATIDSVGRLRLLDRDQSVDVTLDPAD